jgi:hypothetical protein
MSQPFRKGLSSSTDPESAVEKKTANIVCTQKVKRFKKVVGVTPKAQKVKTN